MKEFARLKEHPWLPIVLIMVLAFFSVGCSSSRSDSGATINPLGAYTTSSNTTSTSTIIGDGTTVTPGSLVTPVIVVNDDGSTSINGHDNAPLLDNKHVGWQQSDCLSCHNDTTNNPDHNYTDNTLCYLCHGTNGLPGLSDTIPPVLSSVVVNPTDSSVTISWKSDEDCVSRLILKTPDGDKMEFPVSSTYTKSHKKTINGLQSSYTYLYELVCTDKSGNKTTSSSFSSNLSFQTLAKVDTSTLTSIDTDTGTDTDTDAQEDPFFQNIKVGPKGNLMFEYSFKTKSTPVVQGFLWNVYRSATDARKKQNRYCSDDFDANTLTNEYQAIVGHSRITEAGTYYIRFHATVEGSSTGVWSGVYTVKLNN